MFFRKSFERKSDLKHAIPVVWFGELVFLFRTPRVGPRTPAHDVQDDYTWK